MFEFLDLGLAGIFRSTAMASPLTSEMNIETVEDNGPNISSCLKHTVAQSKVALLTAGRKEILWVQMKVCCRSSYMEKKFCLKMRASKPEI